MPYRPLQPSRVPWSRRSPETASLLNPAFIARLIVEMTYHYEKEKKEPMPFALSFLLLPIVLNSRTRDILPKNTRTGMFDWLQNNKKQHFTFPDHVRNMLSTTQEGIMFAVIHLHLAIDSSSLIIGPNHSPYKKSSDKKTETEICLDKAGFIGRWFAKAGKESTIYAAWGVKP